MYEPRPDHKFTFGLWTVGNLGRDTFGNAVRQRLTPIEVVKLLSEVGAYGVNFHDNDLVPMDASWAERAASSLLGPPTPDRVQALKDFDFDPGELGTRSQPYEELDQLTIDLLLGTR